MQKTKLGYINNGILVTPNDFSIGDTIKLTYRGDLAKSGANEVYAHFGYGQGEWKNITSIKMSKTKKGFETKIPVLSTSKLNIVFKDDSNQWDNNNGENYSVNPALKYSFDCICLSPNEFSVGDTVTLTYKGLLFNEDSKELYAHIGYGKDWEKVEDLKMKKTTDGFEAKLKVSSPNGLTIAFKNESDVWDNNSGQNYCLF